VDVDLSGWVGVGLGGNCDCRCGILYDPVLGVVFYSGLVSLTSSCPSPYSPYSPELFVLGGGLVCPRGFVICACASAWRIWFYGSGLLVFFLSFLGVWEFLFLVCVRVVFCSCVVHSNWCRIIESLCLGPLYFLWLFTRICVVFGAPSS